MDAVTRSHLGDGRCVAWQGRAQDTHIVIDAELANQKPPAQLSRKYGDDDFWERWTRAECAAKLAGVPIAAWLRANGMTSLPGRIEVATVRAVWLDPHLVVSIGTWATTAR